MRGGERGAGVESRRASAGTNRWAGFVCAGMLLSAGMVPAQETLVLTQVPHAAQSSSNAAQCLVDACYPAGSRVVSSKAPFAPDHVTVLSAGLAAAGMPVVSYDGGNVLFAGKENAAGDWQIYEARVTGGRPRRLTAMKGGAAHPAVLGNGDIVFASPATVRPGDPRGPVPQLYLQAQGGAPRQLTFGPGGAADPTILLDGRILFVSAQPSATGAAEPGTALYTVNNDGTEITAFACQHDSPAMLRSPRQLHDGRVAFLVTGMPANCDNSTAETVQLARPFASRTGLLAAPPGKDDFVPRVSSVEPCGQSNLLICAQAATAGALRWACYRVSPGATQLGAPLLVDSAWETIQAVVAAVSAVPMGRISTMDPNKRTGQILCLDVNNTTVRNGEGPVPKATRVRLLAGSPTLPQTLGEVAVQPDGSFMAEIPADVPMGFEALDQEGKVVRREAPAIWLRAGENRACVGCHAAHNRAPHNQRPLAVRVPVPRFSDLPRPQLAKQSGK